MPESEDVWIAEEVDFDVVKLTAKDFSTHTVFGTRFVKDGQPETEIVVFSWQLLLNMGIKESTMVNIDGLQDAVFDESLGGFWIHELKISKIEP